MKRNIFFISFLVLVWFFAFNFNAWSSPVETEPVSKIQNIILYQDRAMIKKEAVSQVQKGENRVKITGITPYLMDQFPVSRNEKIKVDLDAPKKDEAKIAEDGLILWNLRLAPHEKKTLNIKFSVEHPKDLKITGLE